MSNPVVQGRVESASGSSAAEMERFRPSAKLTGDIQGAQVHRLMYDPSIKDFAFVRRTDGKGFDRPAPISKLVRFLTVGLGIPSLVDPPLDAARKWIGDKLMYAFLGAYYYAIRNDQKTNIKIVDSNESLTSAGESLARKCLELGDSDNDAVSAALSQLGRELAKWASGTTFDPKDSVLHWDRVGGLSIVFESAAGEILTRAQMVNNIGAAQETRTLGA